MCIRVQNFVFCRSTYLDTHGRLAHTKSLSTRQPNIIHEEACVNGLVEQYDALLSYFHSTKNRTAAVKRIGAVLEKPITKAYLLFLSVSLPIINNFNNCMQKQAPFVHLLQQELVLFVNFCYASFK